LRDSEPKNGKIKFNPIRHVTAQILNTTTIFADETIGEAMDQELVSQAAENGKIVLYAAYTIIGIIVFLISRAMMLEEESRLAQENLSDNRNRKSSNPILKLLRPILSQYVSPKVRGKKRWDEKRKIYKRKIIAGGLRDEITPDEFIALKLTSAALLPIALFLFKRIELYDFDPIVIALSIPFGYYWGDIWIHFRRQKRQQEILKAMPFIVDLLALSTEAGLDFLGAIGKVVEKAAPSPFVEEFAQLLKEIKVGSSRQDALREMAFRCDMSEVNSFVSILISADQMGASIGKILRQQSEQIRMERMIRAEKAGAAAAQKVLFPLMFLIVPAVFIMVIAPFAIGIMNGGGADL